jgi:hypothetical protein
VEVKSSILYAKLQMKNYRGPTPREKEYSNVTTKEYELATRRKVPLLNSGRP